MPTDPLFWSCSFTTMLAILAFSWTIRDHLKYSLAAKIFAVSTILFSAMHLILHTGTGDVIIQHIVFEDGYIILAIFMNLFCTKERGFV